MAELRDALSQEFDDVRTYIQSGNVVLRSELPAGDVARTIEDVLPRMFDLDSAVVRALALDAETFRTAIGQAPAGFGEEPKTFRYDVGFFIGVSAAEVRPHLPVHPEVDAVAYGEHAFYHRRLLALASRSRLSRVVGTPVYASLTIRNWRTSMALAAMLDDA